MSEKYFCLTEKIVKSAVEELLEEVREEKLGEEKDE